MLCTGPLTSPITNGQVGTQDPDAVDTGPAQAQLPLAAAAGPLPLLPKVDLGRTLGLGTGQLMLDGSHLPLVQAVANHYARRGQWTTYPFGPAPAVDPAGSFGALARDAGVAPALRDRLGLVDDGLLGDHSAGVAALEAGRDLLHLEQRLNDLGATMPGGVTAFIALLDREARGQALTDAERARLDTHLTSAIRDDLSKPLAHAHLLWPGIASQADAAAPASPWAGTFAQPFVPAADGALMAQQARQAVDAVALLAQAYGQQPAPVPSGGLEQAIIHLAAARHQPLTADQLAAIDGYAASLDDASADALARLVEAAARAAEDIEQAYAQVPRELLAPLMQPTATASPDLESLLAIMETVEETGLVQQLSQAVLDVLATAALDPLAQSGATGALAGPLDIGGLIYVGTGGDDVVTSTAWLIVEPSGNDRHNSPSSDLGAQFVFDLEGDDVYQPRPSGTYCAVLGGGYYGVGVLQDLAGNDQYANGDCAMGFGTGYLGLGVFHDAAGDDTYRATATASYPQARFFGAGFQGAGFFLDTGGHDRYATELGTTATAFGAAAIGGFGSFLDRAGDDEYRNAKGHPAFGVATGAGAVAHFTDLEGNDAYAVRGPAFGFGPLAAGTFLDAGGADEYDQRASYAPAQCIGAAGPCAGAGNDQVWTGKNGPSTCIVYLFVCLSAPSPSLASSGADADLGLPSAPNVQARIAVPRSGVAVARDEDVTLNVSALNTGADAVSAVRGLLVISSTTQDATPGEVLAQETVDFGAVPAHGRVDRNVSWRSPAEERALQVRLVLASAGDADPGDNTAIATLTVEDVRRIELQDLYITTSGKVLPGMDLEPTLLVRNLGNVAYDAAAPLPMTLSLTRAGAGSPEQTITQDVHIGRPSAFYDPGAVPVEEQVRFALQAPTTEGNYTVRVSVPASENADPDALVQVATMQVLVVRDLAVEAVNPSYILDPAFFERDGGFSFRVRNTGTVPITGATISIGSRFGIQSEQASDLPVPDLAADEAATFPAPALAIAPTAGARWVFDADLAVADDAIPANNDLTRTVVFERSIAWAYDFEIDEPESEVLGGNRWERGVPTHTAVSPIELAGPTAWTTGLGGSFPQGSQTPTNHDLVLHGIDLGDYLDPRMQFQHTTDGTYGSVTYNYGLVYSVAVRPSGEEAFIRIEPEGGYPCRTNYGGQADTGPGYCLTRAWSLASFDLAAYAGMQIDVRLRVSTPSYLSGAARGWTIDDLRVYGERRLADDLQVLATRMPEPLLAGVPASVDIDVRNNGFAPIEGVTVEILAGKGTSGVPVAFPALTGPSTLQPLEVGHYMVSWTPESASLYAVAARARHAGADPLAANDVQDLQVAVYDLVKGLDPETQAATDWDVDASFTPPDWALGVPGAAESPRQAATGTRVWATNLNGAYTDPDEGSGTYAMYQTLRAPPMVVTNHTAGDGYHLAFKHQHELASYYGSYSDLAYATAKVNGAERLLEPAGGYPGKSTYGAPYSPFPPSNPDDVGYTLANERYEQAMMPVTGLAGGDVVEPGFTVYANYCYDCERQSGWTLDDIMLLRAPRFDRDVDVDFMGPSVLDLGTQDELQVLVRNAGRLRTEAFPLTATLALEAGTQALTRTVMPLDPGESRFVSIPVDVPLEVGLREVEVRALWPADEWLHNDASVGQTRLARVVLRANFEEGSDGFRVAAGQSFKRGPRTDGPAIQGLSSWHTGPFSTSCCSGQDEALAFPPLDLDTGVLYPRMVLTGQIGFSVYPCNGYYSIGSFRLTDTLTQEVFDMLPARMIDMHTSYAPTGKGMCVENPVGQPLAFTTDLTHRQSADPQLELVWDGTAAYYGGAGNTGMELDDVAAYGIPFGRNVGLTSFASPSAGLVGPGEEIPVTVGVVGSGIAWPLQAVGVRIFSNDALGPGGAPSLDQVLPVPQLALGETYEASVPWRPEQALDGQSLLLSAALVDMATGEPLADELAVDNTLAIPVSVLSIHNLAVDVVADPNVDPDAVKPVHVAAQIRNLGTRTEDDVRVTLTYTDAGGAVLRQTDFPPLQKRPDAAQPPTMLGETWTPPGPGRYDVTATLQYANAALDVDRTRHTARSQIHAARLPDRLGATFDDADPTAGWGALGGLVAEGGFLPRLASDAPEGQVVLSSGPYEPGARYLYALRAQLQGAGDASLAWTQRLDLGTGDEALVQGSRDNGASWQTLAAFTGASGWGSQQVDLAAVAGGPAVLRFLLQADGLDEGHGWDIDDVRVQVAGASVRHLGFEDPYGEVLLSWDFESTGDEGWSHDAFAPTGSASGIDDWAHGAPTAEARVLPRNGARLWKTNLAGDYTMPCYQYGSPACPATDNTYGARWLTSPAITVPTGRDQVTLTWWQWLEVYTGGANCSSTCYGAAADLASVHLLVDGERRPVQPLTGYGASGPEDRAVGGRGWSGSTGGWQFQAIDLTAYAGQSVQVVYQLATPKATTDFYRHYYFKPVAGSLGGFAVDDVRLQATSALTAANTAVKGVELAGVPLAGRDTGATVRLARTGPPANVTLDFEWIGRDGAVLPAPETQTVDVGAAGAEVPIVLPGVASQPTLLRVLATSPTDSRAVDDALEVPVLVQGLVYATAFGSSGDAACGKTSPCMSWTHAATSGTDEWEHGSIPSSKFPEPPSAPFAFATDISGETYETNTKYRLTSPTLAIPAGGATLRFEHALETNAYATYYFDGGRIMVSGTPVQPEGGYTLPDCGYYAEYTPCWHGTFGWRPETVSLDAYAGRSIKVDFQFMAGPADSPTPDPPAAGWGIDDVVVSTPPPAPPQDLALVAPDLVKVDQLDPRPMQVILANRGTAASQPLRLEATYFRDGQPLAPILTDVPGLAPSANKAVAIPLPAGPVAGLQARVRLLDLSGERRADGDPTNDAASIHLAATTTVLELPALPATGVILGDAEASPFRVRVPQAEPGAPELAFVAGFGDPLASEQSLVLPAVSIPPDAELDFRHRVAFAGKQDGAFVEASLDGGRTWRQLDPVGGYPALARATPRPPCVPAGDIVGRCYSSDLPWSDARVPLADLAGKTAWLRLRYVSSGDTDPRGGWAIGAVRITADGMSESLVQGSRWAAGPITNPAGPIEEASQPNAWGTGLATDAGRDRVHDVLQSPAVLSKDMLLPTVGFDWYGADDAGRLLVQVLGPHASWQTVGVLSGRTQVWQHAEFELGEVGEWTQVRFVHSVPELARAPRAAPGFFVDNVLVGSLRGAIDVILPGEPDAKSIDVVEASSMTLPVLVRNPGAFTNKYQLEVRGLDPSWIGHGGAPMTLGPGKSALSSVTVDVPFMRERGTVPLLVVARSVFDPLQAAVDGVELNVSVTPKPDYVVKSIGFQSSFLMEGDPVRHVEDARPNTLIAEIENVGLSSGAQPLEVLFLEHHAGGEVFPIDVALVPVSNLTAPGEPGHAPYGAFVEWFPRKGITAVEVVVNPEAIGNRFPANPESDFGNNVQAAAVVIEPRPLPELTYAAVPTFSRMPQVGLPVTLGVDVRNGGNAPSLTPVDVALLAAPQDAFLTSPPFHLPSNSLLRIVYSSDLETRTDGFVVEALDDGGWSRLTPTGGYSHGCLSALGCQSGVSGRADHRMMTFDLAGREGPTQLRLRFAMDSHNGRTFDGLQVHEVSIRQFLDTVQRFDFSSSSAGWTPSPVYAGKDGSQQTVFQFRPREGPVPGMWSVPTDYANPYLVALRSIKAVNTGALEHADLEWTPKVGGDVELLVLVDPKNSEPEFVDDLNVRTLAQRVAVSGFELRATSAPCGTATFCLPDAQAAGEFPVRFVNTGNTRSHFEIAAQHHAFLDVQLRIGDRAVSGIELEAGQAVDGVIVLRAKAAPAAVHTVSFDVLDSNVGKTTKSSLTVKVLASGTASLKVTGLQPFNVVASAAQTVSVENLGNQVIPVLLRAGDKPGGLALRVSPPEFTLAPFESRSVEVEFLNLGVAAKTYAVSLVNARAACPTTDSDCGAIAQMTVTVAEYAPPTAAWNVAEPLRPGMAAVFKDASTSKGSSITAWRWSFGDGTTSTLAQPEHTYAKPGVYAVSLTVADAHGRSAAAPPRTLTVANDAPKAIATRNVESPVAGQSVNFSAMSSLDMDGGIAKVTWAFGDGFLATGLDVTHTYRKAGTYRVVVAVEDAYGAVSLHEMQVTVQEAPEITLSEERGARQESPWPAWAALVALALGALRRRRA